jgi:hypothetical protein
VPTLTLKDVPDGVIEALERVAKSHAKSPADEAVAWLEKVARFEDPEYASHLIADIRKHAANLRRRA